ncbi:MAG: hypothetical protein WDN69_15435 [Aliidongia sp.]
MPSRRVATQSESIAAAQQSDHWFSLYYVLGMAGCPIALWLGDLAQPRPIWHKW